MALIMFILFMGGSLFTISGTLGDDMVNVISFLISEDNLGQDKDTIILGNVKQYLNKCFNHGGNILEELGLRNEDMQHYEKLKEAKLQMEELKNQFNDKLYKFVYSEYNEELTQRIDYNTSDLKLVPISGSTTAEIKFKDLLETFNNYATTNNKKEKWDIKSSNPNTCDSSNQDESHDSLVTYHPKNCYPTVKSWSNDLTNEKDKLDDIKNLIELAKDETDSDSIKKILGELRDKYQEFLESEINTLDKYIEKISVITNISQNYTSENDELFSFLNCKFVKDNVDVILFYLKNSFQNDLYEVGVYLLIAAFSMPFGISFTILLIMISNDEIKANKEKENRSKMINNNDQPSSVEKIKIDNNDENNTEQRKLNNKQN